MMRALRPSTLVPSGFHVESAACDGATTFLTAHPISMTSRCPDCDSVSGRSQSLLAASGRFAVVGPLRSVDCRRPAFRCDRASCRRSIFAERFSADVLTPWARRTARLDCLAYHLGLALGGRPAASFARRLMLPVSNDTLFKSRSAARLSAGAAPCRRNSVCAYFDGRGASRSARTHSIGAAVVKQQQYRLE
jgi:hypothetical protein